eukprot:CAMPEP_0196730196 /NCGR_PEP_ID=MMETSP1091-20130531/10317_1 /TAXON_ID=302021 /ORGANISM="Rhodomonas sp., Strain CCMP768" /LENGTH=71 /DNA_ID=CAMNT_0042073155 /DNA_START=89 /DNA_END=301 /DNA_ORIENTATION=-
MWMPLNRSSCTLNMVLLLKATTSMAVLSFQFEALTTNLTSFSTLPGAFEFSAPSAAEGLGVRVLLHISAPR